MRKILTTLFFLLLIFDLNYQNKVFSKELFVKVNLDNGVSFTIPRNWRVIDQNTKTTLEASVASRIQIPVGSNLPFAANLYDHSNSTIGIINLRVYPEMDAFQIDVQNANNDEIYFFDQELYKNISKGVSLSVGKVIEWYGTTKVKINNKLYLLSKYKRHSAISKNKDFKVRLIRLLDGKNSFTLTLSYSDHAEYLLKPIIDKIQTSLKTY